MKINGEYYFQKKKEKDYCSKKKKTNDGIKEKKTNMVSISI